MSSRLQTLEKLLADNNHRLAVRGKKILEELATFQKTQIKVEVTVTEPVIHLKEAKPFDARTVILLKTAQGKTKPGNPSPDIYKLTCLRQKYFVRGKDAKLVSWPHAVHSINDDIWTCQEDGTVQIFDRDLKLLRKLSDQQWGDVCDVIELPSGDVALAGRGGLFHLTATGETKTAIDTQRFCLF